MQGPTTGIATTFPPELSLNPKINVLHRNVSVAWNRLATAMHMCSVLKYLIFHALWRDRVDVMPWQRCALSDLATSLQLQLALFLINSSLRRKGRATRRVFMTFFLPLLARLPPWILASLENMKISAPGNTTNFLKTESTKLPNKADNNKKI